MPCFTPTQLAQWTGGRWTAQPVSPLSGFSVDSRLLRAEQVFVALTTDRRDGHDFLASAASQGATAALVARAVQDVALPQLVVPDVLRAFQAIAREHRRLFAGPVVGITGSCGKTSTKNLLATLLGGDAGGVLATEGNLNNHIGVPLTLTRLDPLLHRFAVVEAGISAPGEMAPLAGMIEPDVAITTLIAPAHLAELGGLEGVAREKSALSASVRPGGVAIFSTQCAEFAAFRQLQVSTMVVSVARDAGAPRPVGSGAGFTVVQDANATTVLLEKDGGVSKFVLPRVSDGMAQNAALAICAAARLRVPTDAICSRLAGWQPAAMRGEWRREGSRLLYLDCYNANPAAMLDALANFSAQAPAGAPRLYVIGCMEELGPDAPRYHRELGRALPLRSGDRVYVMGGMSEEVRLGALAQGTGAQVSIADTIEPVSACVAGWSGAVFVKGSRRYQLERAVGVAHGASTH